MTSPDETDESISFPNDWPQIKKRALERDEFSCVECESRLDDEQLYVLYDAPPSEVGEYGLPNVSTVCEEHSVEGAKHFRTVVAEEDVPVGNHGGSVTGSGHDGPSGMGVVESEWVVEEELGFGEYRPYLTRLGMGLGVAFFVGMSAVVMTGLVTAVMGGDVVSSAVGMVEMIVGAVIRVGSSPVGLFGVFAVTYLVHLVYRDAWSELWPSIRDTPAPGVAARNAVVSGVVGLVTGLVTMVTVIIPVFEIHVLAMVLIGFVFVGVSALSVVLLSDVVVADVRSGVDVPVPFVWDWCARVGFVAMVLMVGLEATVPFVVVLGVFFSTPLSVLGYVGVRWMVAGGESSGGDGVEFDDGFPVRTRLALQAGVWWATVKEYVSRWRGQRFERAE